ncbi:ANTAR domain-containing protein [Streptomyces sp. G45]|uniref:ANTAR domain-containing protein n=1 Tax=Streptomyces sp. G45 TaxID=3406627 RepID=UPI003C1B4933
MISLGMAEVLRSLRDPGGTGDPAEACARALGVPGVAVSLLLGTDGMAELLWCFPELSERFEDLQFTLGEGPGPDAVRTGAPVIEPDLRRVRPDRWPALLPSALELGVRGVSCFPLGLGAVRLGVLTVLCGGRRLSEQQYADAIALAAALTGALLSGAGKPEGEAGGLYRAVVHQATGMVSVQLDVPVAQALLRLRAHAYGSGRTLGEVAADVVARRLRFDGGFDTAPDTPLDTAVDTAPDSEPDADRDGDFRGVFHDDGDDENGPHTPEGGEG